MSDELKIYCVGKNSDGPCRVHDRTIRHSVTHHASSLWTGGDSGVIADESIRAATVKAQKLMNVARSRTQVFIPLDQIFKDSSRSIYGESFSHWGSDCSF